MNSSGFVTNPDLVLLATGNYLNTGATSRPSKLIDSRAKLDGIASNVVLFLSGCFLAYTAPKSIRALALAIMSPHTVLVTGGSSGLGLQIVRRLYTDSTAYEIIIACRDAAKGNRVAESLRAENGDCSNSLSVIEMDVERDDSIGKAFQSVRQQHEHIDTIINNAGGNFDPQLAEGKIGVRDLWQKTWNINVAGAQIVTQTFMSLLLKASSPRLIFITSGTSSIAGTERMDTTSMRMMNSSPEAGWPKPLSGVWNIY